MKRIEKLIQYLVIFTGMLILLFVLNVLFIFVLGMKTSDESAYPKAEKIAGFLQRNDEGGFIMPKEGIDVVDSYNSFVMVIGTSGEILWEYKLPEELKQTYTIKDVAVFSKWYLKDYPVDIYVIEEGILVLGRPKGTIWKYNLSHSIDTVNALVNYIPPLLLADVLLLLIIPFLILYHQTRRKEKERTTWIAGVSHDIRTPLSLVLGYADAIKKESSDIEAMQKAQVIEEQAIRIRTLITNLNTENKLAYGMGNWHKEKLLLPALIREVICELMNCDLGEQYDLDVNIPEELEQLSITGDKELIRRMLENLVNNAIVHNPQGCCISVTLRKKKMRILFWYELEISDNGSGASRQQLKKLRAPLRFEKLSEHGLGIRLVRRIVAMHHWRVRFGNQRNGGFCCKIQMFGR